MIFSPLYFFLHHIQSPKKHTIWKGHCICLSNIYRGQELTEHRNNHRQ